MNSTNVKVDIQGVDTTKLPKLTGVEQLDMLKKIKNGEVNLKDKFIFAISHKKFMDYSNIPLISLVNVTRENFIKS